MAVVQVHMWTGRSVEQKRRLCQAITDAMVEHAGAQRDGLHVIIHEIPKDSWARGGVMGIDRKDLPNESSAT
jgi:4-oxalocrotonate tautomerase